MSSRCSYPKPTKAYVKAEWGYDAYFSSFNSSSRGVMILLNNNFEHKVEKVISDVNGNYLILDINIEGISFILVNIYGPNEDEPKIYSELRKKYKSLNNERIILCGDWTLVLNPDLDTNNYLHINKPRARQEVLNILEDDEFLDTYRAFHEEKREYTWCRRNPIRKQARLDLFLTTFESFVYSSGTNIIPGYRSDHSGILLDLDFNINERGRGYWKFNNLLLKDQQYIDLVIETILEVKQTYAVNNKDNNQETSGLEFSINDQLFYETLLLMIRGNTIKYSSFKKKKQKTARGRET